MKHKDKVKLARKMRSHKELVDGVPLFQTKAWSKRSDARRAKEAKRHGKSISSKVQK